MFRCLSFFLFSLLSIFSEVAAQYVVTAGIVTDSETRRPLSFVNVRDTAEDIATLTNADGEFLLKSATRPRTLCLSHVGYSALTVDIDPSERTVKVSMLRRSVGLPELLVASDDPLALIRAARKKITSNYSRDVELLRGFYRETTRRGHRFIYVAEALTDVYKTPYTKPASLDAVSISRARRIISTQAKDTLGAKMAGGPALAVCLDVVKDLDILLSEESLRDYNLSTGVPEYIGNRSQAVVIMEPKHYLPYALYRAKLFIDIETLAFSRVELSLDMRDPVKASRVMLVSKPLGVRFRPREMTLVVSYCYDGDSYRINFVRSDSRFQCDWRRRLFHSSYEVVAEMVVTARAPKGDVRPIRGRAAFPRHSSLYDKVELFDDPDFWGDANIIAPTESLEHGIEKLKRLISKTRQ